MRSKESRTYTIWAHRVMGDLPIGQARTFWVAKRKARRWLKKSVWFTSTPPRVEIRDRGVLIWHKTKDGGEAFLPSPR